MDGETLCAEDQQTDIERDVLAEWPRKPSSLVTQSLAPVTVTRGGPCAGADARDRANILRQPGWAGWGVPTAAKSGALCALSASPLPAKASPVCLSAPASPSSQTPPIPICSLVLLKVRIFNRGVYSIPIPPIVVTAPSAVVQQCAPHSAGLGRTRSQARLDASAQRRVRRVSTTLHRLLRVLRRVERPADLLHVVTDA